MKKLNFSHDWRFHYQKTPTARLHSAEITDWRRLDLPHDWSIELPRHPDHVSSDSGGYFPMGLGWYEKEIPLETDWRDKKVYIEFEGVYMNAEVWLNHHYLGRHPYGYTSFHLDLTPYLDWEGSNTLKVLVDNSHQLNSRWYSGSGIYRPVWLLLADPLHIAHWGVYVTTPEISTNEATVNVRTAVQNERGQDQQVTLSTRILAPDGEQVGRTEEQVLIDAGAEYAFQSAIPIPKPLLWSPESPSLYQAVSELYVAGSLTDSQTTRFGIRSLEFSAEKGFLLNGEPLLLKGGCVHHDNGILGAASYPRAEARKVALHKANGFNAIRCAHNPPAPSFLDACDRLGMLVIDEAFDCWRDGKNVGDYHIVFDDWWQRDLESMIYRDRNHPSIILWSIGNEVVERDGYGQGYGIAQQLADHVRRIDPTRPVTAAICGSWRGDPWEIMDSAFIPLDVGGYNYQWIQYRPDHKRFPKRIMMGTESFPAEAFENWQAVRELPYVIGDFVWTSLDYLGEAGIGRVIFDMNNFTFLGGYPWHQAICGDLDLCGFKRPQSYYRDMLWRDAPQVYIAVHPPFPQGQMPSVTLWGWPDVWPNWNWPGHEGETMRVEVYANCEEIELFLDGQSLGRAEAQRCRASFEVPYTPGVLRAVGTIGDQAVADCVVRTVGEPARIRLRADRTEIQADGSDLCYIMVETLDAAGNLHPTAGNLVGYSLEGPGSLLAIGSADSTSEEPYVGKQRKVHRGRALVIVKAGKEPGVIHVRAHSESLEGSEIEIRSR